MRIVRLFLYGLYGLTAIATVPSVGQQKPKYLDPGIPTGDRINDLLPRMTIDEKASQIVDSWGSAGIPRLNIPALLKTEGLHSQSYSTGATLFPQPIRHGSRAVRLTGANGAERWSTPSEWGTGTSEKSIAVNDSASEGVE
jgi:hypothetical protein